jgi:4-hydroxy-tetrahydrodipicolinate synthase
VTDIKPETVARLAQLPTVIGIKDASGDMPRVTDHRLACGPDFCLLSGVDEQSLAFNAAGGRGCISVTANVAPKLCAEFQAACASGDYDLARDLNDKLYPLHLALFSDASPGPIKYALSRVIEGFPAELRLPMTPPSEASRRQVDAALENAGLI